MTRCAWAPADDPLYVAYHDEEWGVPSHDDRHLYEMLVLEGAQAGLSWSTILRKREGYRKAFANFDPEIVAGFGAADTERLLGDAGIVRNRLKVESAITNAQRVSRGAGRRGQPRRVPLELRRREADRRQVPRVAQLPAETAESRAMSKDLKRRGFSFVGPTICYAFMQSTGMVNDHVVSCFRYAEVASSG